MGVVANDNQRKASLVSKARSTRKGDYERTKWISSSCQPLRCNIVMKEDRKLLFIKKPNHMTQETIHLMRTTFTYSNIVSLSPYGQTDHQDLVVTTFKKQREYILHVQIKYPPVFRNQRLRPLMDYNSDQLSLKHWPLYHAEKYQLQKAFDESRTHECSSARSGSYISLFKCVL